MAVRYLELANPVTERGAEKPDEQDGHENKGKSRSGKGRTADVWDETDRPQNNPCHPANPCSEDWAGRSCQWALECARDLSAKAQAGRCWSKSANC